MNFEHDCLVWWDKVNKISNDFHCNNFEGSGKNSHWCSTIEIDSVASDILLLLLMFCYWDILKIFLIDIWYIHATAIVSIIDEYSHFDL